MLAWQSVGDFNCPVRSRLPRECTLQCIADALQRIAAGTVDRIEIEEPMELAPVVQQFHRHIIGAQARGIVQAIVADRVETGTDDNGRRQVVHIGVAAWRIPRVEQVQCVERRGQGSLDPLHRMIGQKRTPVSVLHIGRESIHQLGRRVNQHLQTQYRAAATQTFLGDSRTEIAPCRIAADRQASRIDP
ncbi:hypothetical protein D3C72_1347920 [compost metagenome]